MSIPVLSRRTLAGGLLLTVSLSSARAQQAGRTFRIGYLSLGSPTAEATRFDAFRAGLSALGYVEGKNLVIDTRWLDGRRYELLGPLAAELVNLKIDVLVTYTTPGVQAAKKATATIPIVFATVGDAVAVGVVASLARPGGNVTGTSYFLPQLAAKRLELLKEAMPDLAHAGVVFNPANSSTALVLAALKSAAQSLKLELAEFPARSAGELEGAVAAMVGKQVGGFVIPEDPMLIYNSSTIANLALKHRLASCGVPEYAQAGGPMAFGIDFVEAWRHAATYVDKILKGTPPADIPVEQATKFRLEINARTAKVLGLALPPTLLARADDVID